MTKQKTAATFESISPRRIEILARLGIMLNSSLQIEDIVTGLIETLKRELDAEAAALFIKDDAADEIIYWALTGDEKKRLAGTRMPLSKGIVGWVIRHHQSAFVPDVKVDPRFLKEIDLKGEFKTRNLICAPLIVRGNCCIGALQILNKVKGQFSEDDLHFLEHTARQAALATDNARLIESLQSRNAQLANLDKRKNEVIQLVAHEFNTPLHIIQASTELLASGALADEEAKARVTSTLLRGVQRLTKLVASIRDLSLVSQEGLALNRVAITANKLLANCIETFTPITQQRKQTLRVKLDKESTQIIVDEALLQLVLHNLVANAVRFTPDGGAIELSALQHQGLVEITVQDTGIGIPKHELSNIFEKFYEVTTILQHKSGDFDFQSCGLGLGLSTAQSILAAHGTKLEVESEEGIGSVFRFRLAAQSSPPGITAFAD